MLLPCFGDDGESPPLLKDDPLVPPDLDATDEELDTANLLLLLLVFWLGVSLLMYMLPPVFAPS